MVHFSMKVGTRPHGAAKATRWPKPGERIWIPPYNHPEGRYRVFFRAVEKSARTQWYPYECAIVERVTSSHVICALV
jgi:hypothetical protein